MESVGRNFESDAWCARACRQLCISRIRRCGDPVRLEKTAVSGLFDVRCDSSIDERGSFATLFHELDFAESGVDFPIRQVALSENPMPHTLRGLHFQTHPHWEAKLVKCVSGSMFDVAVDLRPDSHSRQQVFTATLDQGDNRAVYIPAGFAHGFLTLSVDTTVMYMLSQSYHPGAASGIRWDDPGLDIRWPGEPQVISERDRSFKDHDWSVE